MNNMKYNDASIDKHKLLRFLMKFFSLNRHKTCTFARATLRSLPKCW